MPCKSPHHQSVGDKIALGVCLGHFMEPGVRWARLVAIRNREDSIKKYVVRMFAPGDGSYPTGEYRTTSSLFLVPHKESTVEEKLSSTI